MKFFMDIRALHDKQAVIAHSTQRFVSFETHQQEYREGGAFWPLSVWATQGWDTSLIIAEARPEDIRNVRMAGVCYRIPVYTSADTGKRGHTNTDEDEGRARKRHKEHNDDGDNTSDDEATRKMKQVTV